MQKKIESLPARLFDMSLARLQVSMSAVGLLGQVLGCTAGCQSLPLQNRDLWFSYLLPVVVSTPRFRYPVAVTALFTEAMELGKVSGVSLESNQPNGSSHPAAAFSRPVLVRALDSCGSRSFGLQQISHVPTLDKYMRLSFRKTVV